MSLNQGIGCYSDWIFILWKFLVWESFLLYLWRAYKSNGNRRAALGFLRLLGHLGLIGLLGVIGLLGLLGLLEAKKSNEAKKS